MDNKSALHFVEDLKKLCQKHDIYIAGRIRLLQDTTRFDKATFSADLLDYVDYGYARDMSGPFVSFSMDELPVENPASIQRIKAQIIDREKLLNGGVKSMVDGKVYTQRAAYETSLKDKGYVLLGDDAKTMKNQKPEHTRVIDKKALSEAYDRVKDKYNLRD